MPVTFRPVEKIDYEDFIEVNQIDFQKVFKIRLCAKLPEHKIELEKSIHMGMSSVNDSITSVIKVKNLSELDTVFEWDCTEPFNVFPISGEIKAHKSIEIAITFSPKVFNLSEIFNNLKK